jgi:hypothetical protein
VRLAFNKKGKFVSNQKLQSLCQSTSQILSNPKTSIVGFEVEFFDEFNRKHLLRFSQSEEDYRFKDKLEFKPETLVDVVGVFNYCMKISNETSNRICEW